ncbi:nucleotidyltransferase [Pseudonocardia cypriaca]|uniref:Nucleotidyltransferase-like protein n=1 Tax=Pseudonocardia cypriaca TaxID=882449 RepID=A0A543FPC9_9PSEU|nr:nucleotidyltransferase [Pseudonocardia cypriaca]TQM35626.1 hypothetical protein FB388_7063 [Pseudonocardia cypriaca]
MPAPLEHQLDTGRRRIEVARPVLDEARRRRGLLIDALKAAFPFGRVYMNGSLAHGDANAPLNDIDLGIVVGTAGLYGPGGRGPLPLMHIAADAIRDHLKDEFPNMRVIVEGRRRAVLVSFGNPVTSGEPDFTADVIIALDNPASEGLYIPNLSIDEQWDRAHPEKHTELVLAAITATDVAFARIVRLLKHWRSHHGDPVCSWNLKALALSCITGPTSLLDGLERFFTHATDALALGPTPDPAGVADPIRPNLPMDEVLKRFRAARDNIRAAKYHEIAGNHAHAQQALYRVLPNVIDEPDKNQLLRELIAGATTMSATPTRAWAP